MNPSTLETILSIGDLQSRISKMGLLTTQIRLQCDGEHISPIIEEMEKELAATEAEISDLKTQLRKDLRRENNPEPPAMETDESDWDDMEEEVEPQPDRNRRGKASRSPGSPSFALLKIILAAISVLFVLSLLIKGVFLPAIIPHDPVATKTESSLPAEKTAWKPPTKKTRETPSSR